MIILSWFAGALLFGLVPLRGRIPDDGPMRIPALILAVVIIVLGLASLLIGASETLSRRVSHHFGFDEQSEQQGRIRRRRKTRRR